MFRRLFKRLFTAYGNRRFRKAADYRASSMAEKLIYSGSLQRDCLTGNPLARDSK